MRPFHKFFRHTPARADRRLTAAVVDVLEPRRLFAATLAQPIDDVTVPGNSAPGTIDLTGRYTDPAATDQAVRLDTSQGSILFHLHNGMAPLNVANFLNYVTSGRYNNTFFHRLVNQPTPFVLQGGGYTILPNVNHITTDAPVQNEFNVSNTRGTVAMAKTPDSPDTATSEFFINLSDNGANLDTQNGGFTVFADVAQGMDVVDAITNLQVINANSSQNPNGPFSTLPVVNFNTSDPNAQLTNANLVVLNAASVVAPLVITASSDNPAVVVPSVSAGNLVLTYPAGASGVAHVTVHAAAFDGSFVDDSFQVTVTQPTSPPPPPPAANGPDFTVSVTSAPTAAAVGGVAKPPASASILVTNAGDQPSTTAAHVHFFLSPDQTLDSSDTQITVNGSDMVPALKPGKTKSLKVKYTNPANLPTGGYFLLADVDAENVVAEKNETNNVAASAAAYTITAPFTDLTPTDLTGLQNTIAQGKKEKIKVTIKNNGNVDFKDNVAISLFTSNDQIFANADRPALATLTPKLSLKPGASKVVSLSFAAPAVNNAKFIIAQVDSTSTINESDETNNTIVSSTSFTVT